MRIQGQLWRSQLLLQPVRPMSGDGLIGALAKLSEKSPKGGYEGCACSQPKISPRVVLQRTNAIWVKRVPPTQTTNRKLSSMITGAYL